MACASFVVVSALAPFNHYPAYVTANAASNVNVPDTNSANNGQSSANSTTLRPPTTTKAAYDQYCKGRADNYSAAEPGTKCRRYFRCHSSSLRTSGQKSPSIYLCPGKLVFNGQKCVLPSEYQCQNTTISTVQTTNHSVEVKTAEVSVVHC